MFLSGDFNGHNIGGQVLTQHPMAEIDEITSKLELTQLVNESTNFEPNKNPSCIDLIFTDQPNLVSGVRPSLDSFCHHQITHCRVNYQIPPSPPFDWKIWDYNNANVEECKKKYL